MDFPDVRFNLADNTYHPYNKPNNIPTSYIKNKFLISACPPVRWCLTATRKCIRMHFSLHYVEMRKKLISKGSLLNNMLWELLWAWFWGRRSFPLGPATGRPHPAWRQRGDLQMVVMIDTSGQTSAVESASSDGTLTTISPENLPSFPCHSFQVTQS